METEAIWKSTLAELELTISTVNFSTWVKHLKLESLKELGDERMLATLSCPSGFHQRIVEQRYYGQIQQILEKLTEKKCEIGFELEKASTKSERVVPPAPLFQDQERVNYAQRGEVKKTPQAVGGLNPKLTFDNFVVGSSNNFAHAAAQGVIKSPGRKYNPLFIYGGVGVGKTHLMHAIGHEILKQNPDFTILYISAETFANELISSLQSKKTASFKRKYRSCDLLLIDDIQFISGKEFTQEEFFHTFNELYMSERQIILSSDRPPEEIPKIEERLSSRFMGGLTVDVQAPDYEMRVAILNQKAAEMGVEAEAQAVGIIAERVASNARELEGTFKRVAAMAAAKNTHITEEFASEFFGVERSVKRERVRPKAVIAKTAKYFSYSSSDLTGKSRKAPVAMARHVAMYLLRKELEVPFEKIGELFGNRDHTTIMHGVDKIMTAFDADKKTREDVRQIKNLIFS